MALGSPRVQTEGTGLSHGNVPKARKSGSSSHANGGSGHSKSKPEDGPPGAGDESCPIDPMVMKMHSSNAT